MCAAGPTPACWKHAQQNPHEACRKCTVQWTTFWCQDLLLFRSKECRVASQVAELFDLGSPTSLTPVSKRELLAVLLAALRDSHWCKAVDCQSEPGLMIPISLGVAASGTVQPMHGFDIARALAAAERRLFLLPESRYTCCVFSSTWLRMKSLAADDVCQNSWLALFEHMCCVFVESCRRKPMWSYKLLHTMAINMYMLSQRHGKCANMTCSAMPAGNA